MKTHPIGEEVWSDTYRVLCEWSSVGKWLPLLTSIVVLLEFYTSVTYLQQNPLMIYKRKSRASQTPIFQGTGKIRRTVAYLVIYCVFRKSIQYHPPFRWCSSARTIQMLEEMALTAWCLICTLHCKLHTP